MSATVASPQAATPPPSLPSPARPSQPPTARVTRGPVLPSAHPAPGRWWWEHGAVATAGMFPPPTRCVRASSPVRCAGTPPRPQSNRESTQREKGWGVSDQVQGGRVGGQVEPSRPWTLRSGRTRVSEAPVTRDPEVEDDVYEFWGQLWFIPNQDQSFHRRQPIDEGNLCWVRRDLWRGKNLQ